MLCNQALSEPGEAFCTLLVEKPIISMSVRVNTDGHMAAMQKSFSAQGETKE